MAKKEREVITVYKVGRGRFSDDDSPIYLFSAQAEVQPSRLRLIRANGEGFGYRTYVTRGEYAETPDEALAIARTEAQDNLSSAEANLRRAKRDIKALANFNIVLDRGRK